MKHLFAFISIALASAAALADTVGPAYLYKGSSGIVLPADAAASLDTCVAFGQASALSPAQYNCRQTTVRTFDKKAPPPVVVPPVVVPPVVDKAKIPADAIGFSGPQRQKAGSDISQQPVLNAAEGAFRESCTRSHFNFDDVMVFPGQPGASHLHIYFGNVLTNAKSTLTSMTTTGNSTCAGGTLNRTSYWVPAMIDTATGAPLDAGGSAFYYKSAYFPKGTLKALPPGLRMITGSAGSTGPQDGISYACINAGPDNSWHSGIPTCVVGADILMQVQFPSCWDGVNLDSPDHKSHMRQAIFGSPYSSCPSTHPVPLPLITYLIHYTVKKAYQPNQYRLSSDNYSAALPGGYSGHGDYFFAWDQATMDTFMANCLNKSADCHSFLLGDGTTLY